VSDLWSEFTALFNVFNLCIGPGFIIEFCSSFLIFQQPFSCYYSCTRPALSYISEQDTVSVVASD